MYDIKRVSRARCLLTWLGATAAAAALVWWASPDLVAAHRAILGRSERLQPFVHWLTWLCALATALCAVWGWLVTSVVVLEALAGAGLRVRTPGVPGWARRLVLGVCGAAVLTAAAPAMADERPDERPTERPSVLEGLPLPDRAEGRSVTELVAEAIAETSPAWRATGHHQVRPGDSLWSVAESTLRDSGAAATEADVAAYWPRIYALNRDLVGPDPDLLRPGQRLRLADPPRPTPGEDIR
ncbi:MAG: LysM peptidoglycan-binding domain-containing protein [Actinomycetota bacterium]|nr:LysM peptidoglycan-binding domain-containing protein [Actinomycetota bacterium]